MISRGIFFRDNLRRRKIFLQPRALDLSRLLWDRTLGYQDQVMPGGKILQRLRNLRQKFNWMVGIGVGKAHDLGVQFRRNRLHAEPLEGIHQRVRETVQPIAMLHDALALHIVENFAHLLGRKLVMIQK